MVLRVPCHPDTTWRTEFAARGGVLAGLLVGAVLAAGCQASAGDGVDWGAWLGAPAERRAVTAEAQRDAAGIGLRAPRAAPAEPDNPIAAAEAAQARQVVFNFLVVHAPQAARARLRPIWNYARDDALASDVRLRLRQNGFRVGVGSMRDWAPMKAALDAVDGTFSGEPKRWAIPQHHTVNIRLDRDPLDQTLFAVTADGQLSGGTWRDSYGGVQMSYARDPLAAERAVVTLLPVVMQHQRGWRAIRTESGLPRVPDFAGRVFTDAGWQVGLGPGEFVLIAPHETADVGGLLGTQLMTMEDEGLDYDYYVVIHVESAHASAGD